MSIREQRIGRVVRVLLPSLKLKQQGQKNRTVEEDVHEFLVREFGGYTATTGNLFGFWKDEAGKDSYGEHREFTVGVAEDARLERLKEFLAELAARMAEECLYVEVGGEAVLIYGASKSGS